MSRSLVPFLHRRGCIWYFFWIDDRGCRREESLRTDDPIQAQERYLKRISEIRAGITPTEIADLTLEGIIGYWAAHRQHRVATGTLKSERSSLRRFVETFGATMKLRSLADPVKIRAYQSSRRAAGVSAKTVNNELQTLRGVLQLAQLWHRVEQHYEPMRVRNTDLPRALTKQDELRLVEAALKSETRAVVPYAAVLALRTGMRRGEILGVQRRDLHHEEPQPYINVRRSTTKTDAGARTVALDRLGVWAIRRLVARANELGSSLPEHFLLPTDRSHHTRLTDPLRGKGFDASHAQSSWQAEWQEFRQVAGISGRRFHDLRHTCVTRAAEAGVPIAVIQSQVG